LHVTIERLRTLVLVTGGLLIVALVTFLVLGRWRARFNLLEIPKRLGVDIKQEQNDVVFTHTRGGHTYYKLRASKAVQLAQGNRLLLQHAQLELYSMDGKSVDRITGNEFEYDQTAGTAKAAGPVEIVIERPGVAPAIAPNAKAGSGEKGKGTPLSSAASGAAAGQIDVKTSGLTFDQKTGTATTSERVEFSTLQGDGSSVGAIFDSENGQLTLERAVELNVRRAGAPVMLRAQHAEMARNDLVCRMRGAVANYREGQASAGAALIHFRADGSAVRLDASEGFSLTTANGARVNAPNGSLDFDEQNHPQQGRMYGGVTMESTSEGKQATGSAPAADLAFSGSGELRHVHLERGVTLHSEQTTMTEGSQPELRVRRDWRSPLADIDFRNVAKGQAEIASIRGTGGVLITGETQRGSGAVTPSRMSAETVTGQFGEKQQITQMVGEGHASLEQTTATGTHQKTSGDRLEVHFTAPQGGTASEGKAVSEGKAAGGKTAAARSKKGSNRVEGQVGDSGQIESATVDGNVVLTQTAAGKAGEAPPSAMRATAGHAEYEGTGEWLHLTGSPRIDDGGLQLTADKLDVAQTSGDAFARGDVRATWLDEGKSGGKTEGAIGLGGQGPAHVIAGEAQLHEATGEATFRGRARLWQEANSVSAPVIVLNRTRQILTARSEVASEPVNIVLLSANGSAAGNGAKSANGKPGNPSVVRIKAGDLKYSEGERKATLGGGSAGRVQADTGGATTTSNEVELVLLSPGNHAGPSGGSAQVDKMTARGHVVVNSAGRRGTGEQLVYSGETGEYVLTGTAAAPPKLTDPAHGTVSGESLIFNSRDDSVSIEGQGQKTSTETTAPK
jgi:lipopolysaccharide export system protein LptA